MLNKIIKTKSKTIIRNYIDEIKFFIVIKKYLNDFNLYNDNKLKFIRADLILFNNTNKIKFDVDNGVEYLI